MGYVVDTCIYLFIYCLFTHLYLLSYIYNCCTVVVLHLRSKDRKWHVLKVPPNAFHQQHHQTLFDDIQLFNLCLLGYVVDTYIYLLNFYTFILIRLNSQLLRGCGIFVWVNRLRFLWAVTPRLSIHVIVYYWSLQVVFGSKKLPKQTSRSWLVHRISHLVQFISEGWNSFIGCSIVVSFCYIYI